MTEQEFYAAIGGSYKDAIDRLMRDSLIRKFVLRFPADPSFDALAAAVREQRWDDAFSASHTLKGVALNLAFAKLSGAAMTLTDALRPQNRAQLDPAQITQLLDDVEREYRSVLAAAAGLAEG